ncbi:hypothetical protein [Roseisolibacter agri]|uniref:hypothetical protein n=1 Tax=Roseisolibacter agri TaxID=2014610 RepID=UPI0024E0AB7E|nr:hypothetical protein [Roseisolibacter agri]
MPLPVRWARSLAVLAVAGAAACGDRSAGVTDPRTPSDAPSAAVVPGIAIGADSNPVSIARGASATVNVRVARISGFTGAVTLAVDTTGSARGIRATIANATIAAGDTAARAVTITVDTTATVSTTPASVRITASGTGVTTQTLLLGVVVTAAPTGGAFTLGFAGTTTGSTVVVGQSGTVRVVVRRTGGFTGPVTFTADSAGRPANVTITQGATVGDTVTLNIAAASGATPGNYTVTLRGTGTGVTAQTLALPLTVSPVGTFTVAGPTTATSATAGTTVSIPIRVARTGGFGSRVAFTATGAPAGVTLTFDSTARVGTTDTTVTLRVTLPATLAAGTYPITVSAVTPGLAAQTTTVNLTVAAAGVGFTFGSPLFVGNPVVLASATNVITLPINRTAGFTDPIAFSSTSTVSGFDVSVSPATRNGAEVVNVGITASGDLEAGVYPVTVTATTTGGRTLTTTFNVTVVRNNPSFGFQFVGPTTPLTVRAGGTTTATVTVQRISIIAPTAYLNVTNVARGITVTLDRNTTAEGTVTLTITADATALPGVYAFQLTGATERGVIPPLNMSVTVTAAGTTTTGNP